MRLHERPDANNCCLKGDDIDVDRVAKGTSTCGLECHWTANASLPGWWGARPELARGSRAQASLRGESLAQVLRLEGYTATACILHHLATILQLETVRKLSLHISSSPAAACLCKLHLPVAAPFAWASQSTEQGCVTHQRCKGSTHRRRFVKQFHTGGQNHVKQFGIHIPGTASSSRTRGTPVCVAHSTHRCCSAWHE